jgi:cell division protein FtsN
VPRLRRAARRHWKLTLRLSAGCAGLALLSACASSNRTAATAGYSTDYYVSHAAGNYRPPGPPGDPWGPYINIAASRFDVPPTWIRQVMRVESGGQEYMDGQLTVSPAGAMGLMQLEPETYQEMAARYGLGADPFNPYDNIMAGTAYIHEMYVVYGSPGFLAAYNAGPGRLDSFMNYNRPLPRETQNYVAMIAPNIEGYYPAHRSQADQLALNTLPAGVSTGILPAGYDPDAPARQSPDMPNTPSAPVQVAMLTPPAVPQPDSATAIYSQTTVMEPVQAPPPAPPAYQPPAAVQQTAMVAPAPPPQPRPTFSIIPSAMADTPPPQAQMPVSPFTHQGWAIQVGAYNTPENAKAALGIAELSAVQMLMNGQPMVVSVHTGEGTKYRARVTGLPHDAAVDACQRLAGGPTGCVVLSPDAQS